MSSIGELVEKLQHLAHPKNIHNNFPGYIKKIRFPFFKNLEKDTEIEFNFPLTVFVGQNGCGKSSALQALYGCPEGYSIGNFWFNTATDPIPEKNASELAPSFWYEYYHPEAQRNVQVLKCRVKYNKKAGGVNPDYWEPARPLPKYGLPEFPKEKIPGMLATRWEGLKKTPLYLDFRSKLSAFDKYFYFAEEPRKVRYKTRQDYIRYYSPKLLDVFNGENVVFYKKIRNGNGKKKAENSPCVPLKEEELRVVCDILGKPYTSAKMVTHSFYHQKGESVRFELVRPDRSELNYTEAFAGSGEMSVVTLVHEIFNAPEASLILLDEPEVSLHPGAQKRMLKFLLEQILLKRHQIVLCTHSPALIESLPSEAIKLFSPVPDGYFKVYANINPLFAFSHIGQTISDKIKIIVEDEAAKQLLKKIISLHTGWDDIFVVDFHPGGAKDIFKEAIAFSRVNETKRYFLLDGDQNHHVFPIDLGSVSDNEIDSKIRESTGIDASQFQYATDGSSNGDSSRKDSQKLAEQKKFLQYISDYFRFLPGEDPEDTMILASTKEGKPAWQSEAISGMDAKKAIGKKVAEECDNPTASDFLSYRKRLLKYLNAKHPNVQEIESILKGIAASR